MNRRIVAAVSTSAAAALVAGLLSVNLLAKHPTNDSPEGVAIVPVPKPVPLLSPEEEAKTFNLPKGFRAEVVAAEPMIQHPVQVQFDADGRLWVVEMRGYMPDVDGNGEDRPVGQISILEDTDNDGRMDKSTVFMDKLVLPRALGLVRDGALVAVPPKVMFCRDTDGDGRADQFTDVAKDYGVGGNPEHQPNGLLLGIDNWVWNADYDKRFRYDPATGAFAADRIPDMGQWGISQDDFGRLYHNGNSDYLRAALIPPAYATRNPNYRSSAANVQLARTQAVWPAHAAAVNRGYTPGFLREDGTLKNFTAACAPVVYRGDLLPAEFRGNVFVCESSANVVRRAVISESSDGGVIGKNAYPDGTEFIASTYERFRPVNIANGPDGALYVVDMHHGIIQHTAFVTSYGIAQYHGRELHKHLGTGRIFRIVPEGAAKRPERPQLSKATTAQLIDLLTHPNGWYRDTAQRLIVDRNERSAVAPLRKVATTSDNPLARLHALWALEGIAGLNSPTLNAAMKDAHPKVRAAALRLAEPTLGSPRRDNVLPAVLALAGDKDPAVRLQFVLTAPGIGSPEADQLLADVLAEAADSPLMRDAAITGLGGREVEFLRLLGTRPGWAAASAGRAQLVTGLAQCVVNQGNPQRVNDLLELAVASDWKQVPVLNGFPVTETRKGATRRAILLPAEPPAIKQLSLSSQSDVKAALERVDGLLVWPGKAGYVAPAAVKPLTSDEQARFEAGRAVYDMLCGQCHRPDGQGKDGLAPPLVNSEWAIGSEQRLIRIAIGGLQGPITVNGKVYNMDMPAWKMLDDDKLAAALTYVRRSWGHTASPIDAATVKRVREETASRTQPWTERDLLLVR